MRKAEAAFISWNFKVRNFPQSSSVNLFITNASCAGIDDTTAVFSAKIAFLGRDSLLIGMAGCLLGGRSLVVAALVPIIAIILYQAVDSSWYAPALSSRDVPLLSIFHRNHVIASKVAFPSFLLAILLAFGKWSFCFKLVGGIENTRRSLNQLVFITRGPDRPIVSNLSTSPDRLDNANGSILTDLNQVNF